MDSVKKEIETQRLYEFCHDFKTPLSTIMGMTILTRDELDDREKVIDRLEKIETASSYMLSMINDLLDYSIRRNGSMTIRNDVFNINRIIDLIEKIHASQFAKKNQTFEIKKNNIFQEELVGDFLRLSQILSNLLTNAMKYTGEGGRIALEFFQTHVTNGSLMLEMKVIDNGIGMSESFMKRMFEPYAVEGGKAGYNGESTGLGLYITLNLVTLMGGSINAKSRRKSGSIFTVKIPCGIPEASRIIDYDPNVDGYLSNQKEIVAHPGEYDFSGRCFLIAEDNPEMLDIISDFLKSSGATVRIFQNGFQLLEYFHDPGREKANAILMDIHMPVMNGLETTAKIRSSGRPDSSIPIIALTASDNPAENCFSIETGIDETIKKPIDFSYLYSLLDSYTEQV